MASTVQPRTTATASPTLEHPEKEALRVNVLNFLQTEELATGSLLCKEVLQVTKAAFVPVLFSQLPFETLKTLFSSNPSGTDAYETLLLRCPNQEIRSEVVKLLLHRIDSLSEAMELLKRFPWSSEDITVIVNALLKNPLLKEKLLDLNNDAPKPIIYFILSTLSLSNPCQFILDHFDAFDFPEEASKIAFIETVVQYRPLLVETVIEKFNGFDFLEEQSRLSLIKHLINCNGTEIVIRNFKKFNLLEEASRTEIALWIPSENLLKSFSVFEIHNDSYKAQLLAKLIDDDFPREIMRAIPIQFSNTSIEFDAYRNAVKNGRNFPHHLQHFINTTDHPVLMRVCIEEIARAFLGSAKAANCLFLIDQLQGELERIKAMRWLGQNLHKMAAFEIDDSVFKMLCALMMLHNPTLRDRITTAYIEFLANNTAKNHWARRKSNNTLALYRSQFTQPVGALLRNSRPHIVELLGKLDLSRYARLPSLPYVDPETLSYLASQYEISQGYVKNSKESKEFIRKAQGDLCVYALSQCSSEEWSAISALFANYRIYLQLHSPDNFESQLLNPLLKLLKGNKKTSQKFKRELASFISDRTTFENWINTFPIPTEAIALFDKYRDAPKKYNFAFAEIYCDMLKAAGVSSKQVDAFATAASYSFDLYYFILLEVLDELHHSSLAVEKKEEILRKLTQLLSRKDRHKSSVENVQRTNTELNSLITLLLFSKTPHFLGADAFIHESFSESANAVIQRIYEIGADAQLSEKFQNLFMNERIGGLFLPYTARHKEESDFEVMESIKKLVQSVLNNSYEKDRIAQSPNLSQLKRVRPDLFEWWKNLNKSFCFHLSDEDALSIAFDGRSWLHTKLIIDKHMDIARFPQLDSFLDGSSCTSSSYECSHTLEGKLIGLTMETRRETQIALLREILEFPLDEAFRHDIEGMLHSLTHSSARTPSLTAKTSTFYLDTLLCGTEVDSSCQHLGLSVHHNKCVPGYCDGKFLPLLIQEEKGTTVSRAFLIMNFDEQGAPILFLEKFYTRNLHSKLKGKIEQLAMTIAKERELPLVTLHHNDPIHSYTPGLPFTGKIISHGNNWGDEYSDARGGIQTGPYEIDGSGKQLQYLYKPQTGASSSSPE